MPKIGMEPIRRASLIKATIAEIGNVGTLEVTVSRIAKRAGMSSALAHHYFGSKEAMFLAAMRHVLTTYGAEIRGALVAVETPEARAKAIIRVSFTGTNFRREVVAAWLNFYVLAQTQTEVRRLLNIYQRRIVSNLTHALRPLLGAGAVPVAHSLAEMIDGAYLHAALGSDTPDGPAAAARVEAYLALALQGGH
ncbi:transcriptional regulator BetI [Rhodobacter sp. NTK016B]|uniref:transcriptional regulator BetI n=1 Tax=Rhodobacter sp. NTK016B TaxID=2759676 RepID=UPI001A8DF163|nr:transcriptional regulator BetI [Rhodobacter sp. NTK016B]MBN8290785.1 transcriptional regulator BetI [Rhodobacter sp. NTK016B]